MDSNANFQKKLKLVLAETSKFFKKLSDIFDGEELEIKDPIPQAATKRSKKGKTEKAEKLEKAESDKASSKRSKKKATSPKDPNAPKKPLTAFMLYTNYRRPDIMKSTPGMKITEISSAIGKEWKSMTDEEQQIWREKAKEDKLMYELKLYNYKKDQKISPK